ncbi:hypothetical protein B0A49_12926 [Cryomyces minteri]|uniref:D-xylose 1-dehydrogenase (NADP(+), D-xylono-1,5-lactone-forming) n=1 Tax=Cryomyces minteri TaxID=331657 RepID=A0A4V5N925_9PEZI|nr:hypothetical protein B0A49_12926 [Cryomyces minteri]
MISEWFVIDLLIPRPDAKAHHIIQSIGSSSLDKGQKFVNSYMSSSGQKPKIYGSYEEVYKDSEVDVVYIGTPHAFHKRNCLDAIARGKNVLCEKAFTLTTKEAQEVLSAAKEKGVFVMEAMWTRFFPLMKKLQSLLHEEKVIGDVTRVFCDFGLDIDITKLPKESRLKDPALGAGSLLDIGIYSLTWGITCLEGKVGEQAQDPEVVSTQTLVEGGVDVASAMLLNYKHTGRQGILTSTTAPGFTGDPFFARIEGTKGFVKVEGETPSMPESFTVTRNGAESKKYGFDKPGRGFCYEADAVALDLQAGRKENETMPWSETIRVMKILDGVRKRGGARFPVDDW